MRTWVPLLSLCFVLPTASGRVPDDKKTHGTAEIQIYRCTQNSHHSFKPSPWLRRPQAPSPAGPEGERMKSLLRFSHTIVFVLFMVKIGAEGQGSWEQWVTTFYASQLRASPLSSPPIRGLWGETAVLRALNLQSASVLLLGHRQQRFTLHTGTLTSNLIV